MDIDYSLIENEYNIDLKNEALFVDLEEALDHGVIVSRLAALVAKEIGEDEEFIYNMKVAGLVHDVGKMRLGRYLYGRAGDSLQVEEMKYVRMHPEFSYDILKSLGYNDNILSSVYHHHENYDGSGYPDNMKGEEIPLGARILRVCDVYSALCSDRPYRTAFPPEVAMELMIDEVKNFDMKMFLALQRVVHSDEFDEIRDFISAANIAVKKDKEGKNRG